MTNIEFVERAKALIGRPYAEIDCKEVVAEALGIRFSGTNWLWRSIYNSRKYRYLSSRVEEQPEQAGLLPGDVVFKIVWDKIPDGYDTAPNCYHVGVYSGHGTVIHSSPKTGVREAPFISNEWDGWGRMSQLEYIDDPEDDVAGMTDRDMLRAIYNKIVGG